MSNDLKARIEAMARMNAIDRQAMAIEADIPADTKNEDAIKAREYAQLARKFGMTDEGVDYIAEAQCAFKDYMLWDGAIKAEKFPPGKKKGSQSDRTKHIHQLAADNPSLSAKELFQIANKNIIGEMAVGTFANHVSKSRN